MNMIRMHRVGAALLAVGLSLAPNVVRAQASTQFIGVGSSALWQTTGIAAWELTGKLHHYTFKLTGTGVGVQDTRSSGIGYQQGNMYIVWDNSTTPTKIYVGVSLDSSVGDRLFLGTDSSGFPAGKLILPAAIPAAQNLIAVTWGADDASLPAAVVNDLKASDHAQRVNAAFTDIRPEDAAYQTALARTARGTGLAGGAHTYGGLGYSGSLSATVTNTNWIESSFSTSAFQVVPFNTHGTDPISGAAVPSFSTYRVGFSPIILIANRTNASGLGAKNSSGKFYFTNLTKAQVSALWSDSNVAGCETGDFAVSGAPNVPLMVVYREPLSGTYNTFNYQAVDVPYTATLANQTSQEKNVVPTAATGNPLNQKCVDGVGPGTRRRVIGTGEMVNTAVFGNADSIGYTFFSHGNISKLALSASYGYLTVGGVDPLYAAYSTGELPSTAGPVPTYAHVQDGTYPFWSDLRIVTNNVAKNQATASALANQIIADLKSGGQLFDFLPFSTTSTLYRSHYSNGTYTNGAASNGLSGTAENGGDVNGCVETTGNTLNCRN
jgi:hypothetical protein